MRNTLYSVTLYSVVGIAFGALFGQAALASDFPVKAPVKTLAVVSPHDWGGFYIGANAGYGWHAGRPVELSTDSTTIVDFGDSTAPSRGTIGDIAGRGGFAGGQIGYTWLFAPNWVAGIESDLQYAWIGDGVAGSFTNPNGTFPIGGSANLRIKWFGTLRGRVGFVTGNWLLYATGGLAYGQVAYNLHAFEVGGGSLFESHLSTDRTRVGFALGGGVEYAVAPNVTLKIEYQYIDLGSASATAPVTLLAGGAPSGETAGLGAIDADIHTVRVGLNYRFGSVAPLVGLKY